MFMFFSVLPSVIIINRLLVGLATCFILPYFISFYPAGKGKGIGFYGVVAWLGFIIVQNLL